MTRKENEGTGIKSHDGFFAQMMSEPKLATYFLQQQLPQELQTNLNWKTLQQMPNRFVEKNLRNKITDILYRIKENKNNEDCYILTLIEHQSTPDKLMPLRIFRYMGKIMETYCDEKHDKPLPLVWPMIYYHGRRRPYPFSTDIRDLVRHKDKAIVDKVFDNAYHLLDVTIIPDKHLKQQVDTGLLYLATKNIFRRDAAEIVSLTADFLNQQVFNKDEQDLIEGVKSLQKVLEYLIGCGKVDDPDEFYRQAEQKIIHLLGGKTTMTTMAEIWMRQARNETIHQMVLRMLAIGEPIQKVAAVAGLSLDEVERLSSYKESVRS